MELKCLFPIIIPGFISLLIVLNGIEIGNTRTSPRSPIRLLIVLNGIEMKWKEVSLAAEEDF